MYGRSALLTLLGKETDLGVVAGDMCIVRNIVPSNDFNKQRCYLSTPPTKFELQAYERTELQEPFEGVVESVSFTRVHSEISQFLGGMNKVGNFYTSAILKASEDFKTTFTPN
uniref:Uncharacterized protein n=1 Tax=Magallana gigas TaxID=29159 RepID=A0A8W8IJ25_MAGGI